jgi:hypothetical protein
MFPSLDTALTQILDDATAPQALRDADVSFETPVKTYAPGSATINLFLLEVKENRVLRDPVPIVEFSAGAFTQKQPPVRVDVTYVVSAWSAETGEDKISEEHELLALALAWFSRFPLVPGGLLPGQPFPVPLFTALPDNRLNIGEFWSALGIPPRAAFTLTATVTLDLAVAVPFGPPVDSKEMIYKKLLAPQTMGVKISEAIQIGGVVTQGGNPVDGATVGIASLGLSTLTDAQGRFSLSILIAGNYTLQASKGGSNASKAVPVPPTVLNQYDIQL